MAGRLKQFAAPKKAPLIYTAAVVAPLGLSAALVPARAALASTAAALVLVALIAVIAILGSRGAGIVASASSGLWFDYFLTRPYERFAISHRSDLETTISLFVVGIIVTEIAARGRHHHQVAVQETDYVAMLGELGDMVAHGVAADDVIERITNELVHLLHLRRCRYQPGLAGEDRTTVRSDGRVVLGAVVWGVATMGLPGPELDLPVQFAGRTMGRFVVVPTPGWPVPREQMVVAVALAAHAGAALATRARIA